jgi:hypothetical protein
MAKNKKATLGVGLSTAFGLAMFIWRSFHKELPSLALSLCLISIWCCLFYAFSEWIRKPSLSMAEKLGRWPVLMVLTAAPVLAFGFYMWPKPSFIYVIPGVWSPSPKPQWVMTVRHFGPDSVLNTELLFVDKDRQEAIAKDPTIGTADLDLRLHYDEIDPIESVMAKMFLWSPLHLEDEHYTIYGTSNKISTEEKLDIRQIENKWYYAMKVKNPKTGNVLAECADAKMASTNKYYIPPCFPDYTTKHLGE